MPIRSCSRSTIITAGITIIAATTVITGTTSCRTWSCRATTITAATITTIGGITITAKSTMMTYGPDILRPVFLWACSLEIVRQPRWRAS